MTLAQVKKEFYVPQNVGRITPIKVMSDSRYATLAQNIQLTLENPDIARCYIENKGVGNWTRTAAYSGKDGKMKWVEGGDEFKILDEYNYEGASREGSLELPESGWVKAYQKDGKWIVWDIDENGGFARYTCSNTDEGKQEARESFIEAGLDPRLLSYQWSRSDEDYGLIPVYRFSSNHDGPLYVDASWYFEDFDDADGDLGLVLASGSEQKAGSETRKFSANASEKQKNYSLSMKPSEYQRFLEELKEGRVSQEFAEMFANAKIK